MAVLKGLAAIRKHEEEREARRAAADAPKSTWFRISDGESVKIRPLQELDSESPNYNEEAGQAFLAIEHSSPKDYKRKALCSLDDEGRCLACEKAREAYQAGDKKLGGKWKQKVRFYGNVLVSGKKDDKGNELEPFVAILSQSNGARSITPTLIEYAEEYGSITNRWFKVKRTGAELDDTSYTALGLDVSEFDTSEYELFDLDTVVREVPYDEQAKHYLLEDGLGRDEVPHPAEREVSETSIDADW